MIDMYIQLVQTKSSWLLARVLDKERYCKRAATSIAPGHRSAWHIVQHNIDCPRDTTLYYSRYSAAQHINKRAVCGMKLSFNCKSE